MPHLIQNTAKCFIPQFHTVFKLDEILDGVLEKRNLMAHTYDERLADNLADGLGDLPVSRELMDDYHLIRDSLLQESMVYFIKGAGRSGSAGRISPSMPGK